MDFAVLVRLTPRLDLAPPIASTTGGASYSVLTQIMAVGTFLIASFLAACRLLTAGGLLLQQSLCYLAAFNRAS